MPMGYDEAKAAVVEALAPLGEAYTGALAQGLESRWVDVYENKGKASGAYSLSLIHIFYGRLLIPWALPMALGVLAAGLGLPAWAAYLITAGCSALAGALSLSLIHISLSPSLTRDGYFCTLGGKA